MKTLLRLGLFGALFSVGVARFSYGAGARSDAEATIDRTLACAVLPTGVGALKAMASPRQGGNTPAQIRASTGNGDGDVLVWIHRGAPRTAYSAPWPPDLTVDVSLCHAVRTRVPLTPRGLSGGAAPYWTDVTCLTARQVFVHVHVVMKSPPRWTSQPPNQIAHGDPVSSAIAVQTRKHEPLVYMTTSGNKARFYSARTCF